MATKEKKAEAPAIPMANTMRLKGAICVHMLAELKNGFSSRVRFHIEKGTEMILTGDGTRVSRFGRVRLRDDVEMEIEVPIENLEK